MNRQERLRFIDASLLAVFANLKESETDKFRNAVAPGFVPNMYWGEKGGVGFVLGQQGLTTGAPPLWKVEQGRLQDAWKQAFPPELAVLLISNAAKASDLDQYMEKIMKASNAEAAELVAYLPKPQAFAFQNAVMYLTLQPWRAKICEICQKYFAKAAPRDRYCSPICTREARLRTKRVSASKHRHWR